MGKVTRREWAWAAGFAALVMAATTAPYLAAYAAQTEAWRFSGFILAVQDGNSYIAKMNEGAHGAWLLTLPYSSEPQRGALIYLFYLLLGKIAGPSHAMQVLAYHLARIGFGICLLLVSYRFLAQFLPRVRQRRLGLALVALGGGLGWALILLGQGNLFNSLPVDFISPEAFSFLILFDLPHLAAARSLLLLALLAYLDGRGVVTGFYLLSLGLIQPLYVPVIWLTIGAHWMVQTQLHRSVMPFRVLVSAVIVSAPIVIYTAGVFLFDPVLRQWAAQNTLPAPHPVHYLLAFGPLLALGVPGWRALARRSSAGASLLTLWVICAAALLYLPVGPQRRLIEGVQLALVPPTVVGLTVVMRRLRPLAVPLALAVMLPTSFVLLAGGWVTAQRPAEPAFRPADELRALEWLNANGQAGQVVLSSFETGNVIPAYAPLIAYIGHGPETVFLSEKEVGVKRFYGSDMSEAERRQLLDQGRIAYVWLGPHERALGGFDPAQSRYLRLEFRSGLYAIYSVRQP